MAKKNRSKARSKSAEAKAKSSRSAEGENSPQQARELSTSSFELSEKSKHIIAVVVLIAVGLSYFSPVIFQGKNLVGGDTVQWRAMAQSMIEHRDETGEEPLWATNMFGGMPGYMINYPLQVFQVDSLVRLVSPFMWPLAQFLVLVFGMYGLVYYLSRNQWASLFSALAIALTSYLPILLLAGHNSKYITIAYAPWLILAFVYHLKRPGVLSSLLVAAAAAINLRAGHPQITYNLAFILGIWWIVDSVSKVRSGESKQALRTSLYLIGGGVLALLLVAHPYMAQFEYKAFTMRGSNVGGGGSGLAWDYAMAWSHTWGELGTLLVANLYGGGMGTYWGTKIFTAGPHYIGGVAIALAIYSLVRNRSAASIALGISTFVTLVFSTGRYTEFVNHLFFDYFPFFSSFRVPENWLASTAIAIAILAGLGLARLVDDVNTTSFDLKKASLSFGIPLLVSALLMLMGTSFLDFERPTELENISRQIAQQNQVALDNPQVRPAAQRYLDQSVAERSELMTKDATRTVMFVLVAFGLLFLFVRRKIPVSLFGLGLCLLVLLDLYGVGKRHLTSASFTNSNVEKSVAKRGYDQFILDRVAESGGPGHFRVASFAAPPTENSRPAYFYESVSGYHGAKLKNYQVYLDELAFTDHGLPSQRGMELNGVKYFVANGSLPGSRLVHSDQASGLGVYELTRVLSRAYFVEDVEVITEEAAHLSRLKDPNLDLSKRALVFDQIDSISPATIDSNTVASVLLESYGPREIEWKVNTDQARLLVASEVYYPAGWTALVDNEPAQILRVNHMNRGVVVPAGSNSVRMEFSPVSNTRSLWISWISSFLVYLGIFIFGLLPLFRKKKSPVLDESENG